jgi:hypothetical protein
METASLNAWHITSALNLYCVNSETFTQHRVVLDRVAASIATRFAVMCEWKELPDGRGWLETTDAQKTGIDFQTLNRIICYLDGALNVIRWNTADHS